MNRSKIASCVEKIVIDHLDILSEDYDESADLCSDFGADSLDCIEMLLEVEETFEIHLPDELVAPVRTAGDMIDILVNVLGKR